MIRKMIKMFMKKYVNVVTNCPRLDVAWTVRNVTMLEAKKELEISNHYRNRWHNITEETKSDERLAKSFQQKGHMHSKTYNRLVDTADYTWKASVLNECGYINQTWRYVYDERRATKRKVYTLKKTGVRLKFVGIQEEDWFVKRFK